MNKALEKTSKAIKFNTRMVETTANKIIVRRSLVSKPGNNDSLSTSICANRIAMRNAINTRRKSRPEIKIIHNSKK